MGISLPYLRVSHRHTLGYIIGGTASKTFRSLGGVCSVTWEADMLGYKNVLLHEVRCLKLLGRDISGLGKVQMEVQMKIPPQWGYEPFTGNTLYLCVKSLLLLLWGKAPASKWPNSALATTTSRLY